MTAADAASSSAAPGSPEITDLERRVLAHERVLQALIAYMSRAEPRFVDHLRDRFVEPMKMARREQDHRDADDYAEEFIRAVMLIGERGNRAMSEEAADSLHPGTPTPDPEQPAPSDLRPDRVQMKERGGLWEIKVDGAFWGDYRTKEQALAAVALAKLSLH